MAEPPNEHAARARGRKAYKLARVLYEHGGTDPRSIERLGGHYRRIVEDVAEVNPASPITWAVVAGILDAMVEEADMRSSGPSPSAMTRNEVVA